MQSRERLIKPQSGAELQVADVNKAHIRDEEVGENGERKNEHDTGGTCNGE